MLFILFDSVSKLFKSDLPGIFDNYNCEKRLYKNYVFEMGAWDTAGQQDYDNLRPLSYPTTNCFILCFAVNDRESFESVKVKWYPEINEFFARTRYIPFVLCGLKSDLRGKDDCVGVSEAEKLCEELGGFCYTEVSAMQVKNVEAPFFSAFKAHFGYWLFEKQKKMESKNLLRLLGLKKSKMPSLKSIQQCLSQEEKLILKEVNEMKISNGVVKKGLEKLRDLLRGGLCDDVVLHILNNFFLLDVTKSIYEFRNQREFLISREQMEKVKIKFYGKIQNKVELLFRHFKLFDYHDPSFLPRNLNSVHFVAVDDGRRKILYHPLMSLHFQNGKNGRILAKGFMNWEIYCRVIEKYQISLFRAHTIGFSTLKVGFWGWLSPLFFRILENSKTISCVQLFHPKANAPAEWFYDKYSGEIDRSIFPNVKCLWVNNTNGLDLSSFPNLEEIRINITQSHNIKRIVLKASKAEHTLSPKAFVEEAVTKKLRKLVMERMCLEKRTLKDIFFGENGGGCLEELILYKNDIVTPEDFKDFDMQKCPHKLKFLCIITRGKNMWDSKGTCDMTRFVKSCEKLSVEKDFRYYLSFDEVIYKNVGSFTWNDMEKYI